MDIRIDEGSTTDQEESLGSASSLFANRKWSMIIEIDASSSTWGGVLLESIEGKESVCGYASGSFKAVE